ncbi:MAG: V-type ATP synthase subunit E [Candidatus Hodarchaeales archaeon]
MSIDKIRKQILEETERKAEVIIEEAEREGKQVLLEAQKDVEKTRQRVLEKGRLEIDNSQRKELARARLDAKMAVLGEQEKGIKEALDLGIKKAIEFFNSDQEAPKVLERLVIDAGISLEGGELILSIRQADRDKIDIKRVENTLSEKTGVSTTIKIEEGGKELNDGGIILKKGGISVNNTIRSIFERKYREIRSEVAEILYEKKVALNDS